MGNIAKSISEQLSRILSTLSESSWVPALILVFGADVISLIFGHPITGLRGATAAISKYRAADGVRLFAATLACTVFLQGAGFSLIRTLEGYWGFNLISRIIAVPGLVLQRLRSDLIANAMADRNDVEGFVGVLRFRCAKCIYPFADANDIGLFRFERYPPRERILPTQFGNAMRAGEDQASDVLGGPIQASVLAKFDGLSESGKDQFRWSRSQLDLYVQLTFVWLSLAALCVILLHRRYPLLAILAVVAAWVCYKTCIVRAVSYGQALIALARVPMITLDEKPVETQHNGRDTNLNSLDSEVKIP